MTNPLTNWKSLIGTISMRKRTLTSPQGMSITTTSKREIQLPREERKERDNLLRNKSAEPVQLHHPQLQERGVKEKVPRAVKRVLRGKKRPLQRKAEKVEKEVKVEKVERLPKITATITNHLHSSSSTNTTSHIFRSRVTLSSRMRTSSQFILTSRISTMMLQTDSTLSTTLTMKANTTLQSLMNSSLATRLIVTMIFLTTRRQFTSGHT